MKKIIIALIISLQTAACTINVAPNQVSCQETKKPVKKQKSVQNDSEDPYEPSSKVSKVDPASYR